jgi:hypothetical protein
MGVHARSWKVPGDFRYQTMTITASSHKTTTNSQDMVGFFRAHTVEAVVVLGAVPRCKSVQRTRLPRVERVRSRLFSARGEVVCMSDGQPCRVPSCTALGCRDVFIGPAGYRCGQDNPRCLYNPSLPDRATRRLSRPPDAGLQMVNTRMSAQNQTVRSYFRSTFPAATRDPQATLDTYPHR